MILQSIGGGQAGGSENIRRAHYDLYLESSQDQASPSDSRWHGYGERGKIRFFDDIYGYGYDAELEKAWAAGYPYAWQADALKIRRPANRI